MPGVPPDAVAQVKKGLRGLFNRKKQKAQQYQQGQPEPTATSDAPTSTTTAAAPAPANTTHRTAADEPAPSTEATASHHIAQPTGVEEAKDIDLNPSTAAAASDAPLKPAAPTTHSAPVPISKTEPGPATGMSATSGPLGDHMTEVYTDIDSAAEAKGAAAATAAEAKGGEGGGRL